MWWICAVFSGIWIVTEGIRMYPCGNAGYQDVEENTPATFTCDQYTGTVTWRYRAPPSNTPLLVSVCPTQNNPSACQPPPFTGWSATYISATSSSLTTTFTSRSSQHTGATYSCTSSNEKQCGLNVFVPGVVTKPTTNINKQDGGFTVSLSATITNVYSSKGQYSCVWQLGSERKTTTPVLTPPASNTDNNASRSGSCNSVMSLPSNTGDHPCSVIVSPGNTQKSCDAISVIRPNPPTINCPSDFIPENTNVTCTCNTNIGQPGGRLRWYTGTGNAFNDEVISGSYNVTSLTMSRQVSRNDDNRKFRCVNKWTVNINAQNDYTARVAYGPDSVSIQGPSGSVSSQGAITFHTDASGSKSLTLTCQATGVNPTNALNYSWNAPCDVDDQNMCTFRPQPPGDGGSGDVNKQITCTVINTKNNDRQQQGSVTLDLKYPPRSSPQITGYVNNTVLYQGDPLVLNCTVSGGDPLVRAVSWKCPGGSRQTTSTGQSSSLTISPLTAADHSLTCVCQGQWVSGYDDYYPLTTSRTLNVYYPPDTPSIDHKDQSFPFLEGETPTLTCTPASGAHSLGNPPASLKFKEGGGESRQGEVSLTLPQLTSADHGGVVVCEATNSYTEHRDSPVTATLTLEVYYITPTIMTESNTCKMSGNTCIVEEEQQVHVNCSADSNPEPAVADWQRSSVTQGGSDLRFTATRSTPLTHVCDVRTPSSSPDSRLPRRSNITLTVLTTYGAEISEFWVNDNSSSVTISESDSLNLTCTAVGRPQPDVHIVRDGDSPPSHDGPWEVTAEQRATRSLFPTVTCDTTGRYMCVTSNDRNHNSQATSRFVFVNCSPRLQEGSPKIPEYVNIKEGSVSVVIPLTVFPVISNWTLHYLGPGPTFSKPMTPRPQYSITCTTNATRPQISTCNLTLSNARQEDKGFYHVTLDNGVGDPFVFRFQLDVNGTDPNGSALPIAGVVGGIAAGVAIIAAVAAGIFVFRRKQKGAKKPRSKYNRAENGRDQDTDDPEMITNELYGTAGPQANDGEMITNELYGRAGPRANNGGEDENMIVNTFYESSDAVGAQAPPPRQRQPKGSEYEEVGAGATPMGLAGAAPTAAASAAGSTDEAGQGLYASVKKDRRKQPPANAPTATAAATADDSNVYTTVDKTKKKAPAKPAAAAAAKPEVKAKPGKKGKDKKKAKKEAQSDVYGNIPANASARAPPPGQESTVYENYAFDAEEGAKPEVGVKPVTGAGAPGRSLNPDGLVYTTVAFSKSQRDKENQPAPDQEKTEYAAIGFPPQEDQE